VYFYFKLNQHQSIYPSIHPSHTFIKILPSRESSRFSLGLIKSTGHGVNATCNAVILSVKFALESLGTLTVNTNYNMLSDTTINLV